jgi:hypothetical protein
MAISHDVAKELSSEAERLAFPKVIVDPRETIARGRVRGANSPEGLMLNICEVESLETAAGSSAPQVFPKRKSKKKKKYKIYKNN